MISQEVAIAAKRLATEYRDAEISVIPLRLDGSKAPAVPRWKTYQTQIATDAELDQWFARPQGIGLVCGVISGGLEVIDFDDGSLFKPWRQMVKPIVEQLPVVETGGGGWHLLYRCEVISGNQKIAMSAKHETLIETRGEGGYIVGEGSPCSVHASGLPYVQYSGPYLPQVPTITVDERRELWKAARTFDQAETLKSFLPKPKVEPRKHDGDTPWDDFNRRASWSEILVGWTQQSETEWTRPGKSHGTSATVRRTQGDDAEVLVVFSSNAGAVAPTNGHKTLSKFEAFKQLQHNGDGKVAAKAVMMLGYGGARL